jgi:hypothetical protein
MTTTDPEERTLDVLVGGRRALAARMERTVGPNRANLGTAFIGIGAALVVAIRALYGFVWFVGQWQLYPHPGLALAAWALLIAVLVGTFAVSRLFADGLPTWMFAAFILLLAVVIALDVVSLWDLHDLASHATASLTAAMALVLVITLRPEPQLLVVAGVFTVGIGAAMVLNTPLTEPNIAPIITSLSFAFLPVFIASVVVRGFRRMVQIELDRALVQSTVSAPRFAVGMLASEELARLDLAAEDLLDSIAQERTALPLDPKTASVAATLATELRLHLIEGRRETWLYHAISESELLGRCVTVDDRGGLAGLLDPTQRDGLLGGIWALVSDVAKPTDARTVTVTIGPVTPNGASSSPRMLSVPVVIETTGVPRNRIDPSTWDALRRVGRYSDTTQNGSLRVDIECFVANPADV